MYTNKDFIMGYDIYLVNTKTKKTVKVPLHREGSTFALGGSEEAKVAITFNYSEFFYEHIDKEKGLEWLNGKTGLEVAPKLATAICKLGQTADDNYWKSTPGNAGKSLNVLLKWVFLHPEAIFEVHC
jgi:hypothetical protein